MTMHSAFVALVVCWLVVLTVATLRPGQVALVPLRLRTDGKVGGNEAGGNEAGGKEARGKEVGNDGQWRFPPSTTFLDALRTCI